MKEYEKRRPATEKEMEDSSAEASLWLERTDLLLSQLSAELRLGRVPEEQTAEQHAALALVKAALDTYVGFFYPPYSSQ